VYGGQPGPPRSGEYRGLRTGGTTTSTQRTPWPASSQTPIVQPFIARWPGRGGRPSMIPGGRVLLVSPRIPDRTIGTGNCMILGEGGGREHAQIQGRAQKRNRLRRAMVRGPGRVSRGCPREPYNRWHRVIRPDRTIARHGGDAVCPELQTDRCPWGPTGSAMPLSVLGGFSARWVWKRTNKAMTQGPNIVRPERTL